jgi:hypothetical protein
MNTTSRTLVVKAVGYKPARNTPKDWQPPRIEDEILKIMLSGQTVGQRHCPKPKGNGGIKDGTHCLFINNHTTLKHGVLFTVCAYTKGHVPEAIAPDMTSAQAAIQVVDLKADDGQPSELVLTYRCLAYGQILIVESVAGGGGVGGLAKMLRVLIKACSADGHGVLELSDIGSSDLHALINSRGGISKVTASLVHEVGGQTSRFARPLGDMKGQVQGTNRCMVSWMAGADETLDEDDALAVLEEADSEFLASVTLSFKEGGGVSDLTKYRERKPVKIQLTPDGRPAVTEIETAMKEYLVELRDPSKQGPIKTDGTLKTVKKMEAE